uniref:Signal peptide peptidase-like 2B n=1 Tax=Caenorhabditis japonica TaxID=281687 RepID=A0A8R1EBM4_CAEJA
MPSMKVITIILVAMYFYDAFMVFGTPYLTTNGCSIMVQVATGIDDCTEHVPEEGEIAAHPTAAVDAMALPEKFPMMILVPQMDPMNECMDMEVELSYPISILGLGDIVLPGYLISHCFTMSGFTNKGRLLYGFVALSGYALGLVATFAALMMYQVAQPALIYLVPCTLLPVLAVAAIRQEFGGAWAGCDGCMTILYNHQIPGCSSSNESESKKEKEVGDVVFENAEESTSTETAICGESTSVNDLVIL